MNNNNSIIESTTPLEEVIVWASLISAFVYLYFPVWKGLINFWAANEDYSHGFLIIPICIYLIVQKKDRLAGTNKEPSWIGLLISLMSLLLYIVGKFAGVTTVASFSMIPFAMGVVALFWGFSILKELLFVFFIALFMIPIPAQIFAMLTIPLQLIVSKVSVAMASFANIPIYREGNIIHLPELTLQVVNACSGLRSLISLLLLSAMLGYLTLQTQVFRGLLFIMGIPTAIFVNIVRVFIIIIGFYFFNVDLTKGMLHTAFGLMVFVLALLILYLIKKVFVNWEKSTSS